MFFYSKGDAETRAEGLKYLIKAYLLNDAEASYLVASLMLQKVLKPESGVPEEHALGILCRLADRGDLPSREMLNRICLLKYEHLMSDNPACPTS